MENSNAAQFIEQCYARKFGAEPALDYPGFWLNARSGELRAACGFRRAHLGPLFLERYLDVPIEVALIPFVGREPDRENIVEIGSLAADTAPAMVSLWADAANDLGDEAEVAVAVLTAPLRRMFARLGLDLYEIAPARPERMGADAFRWGKYYEHEPVVCAGRIAEGQTRLGRFRRTRP